MVPRCVRRLPFTQFLFISAGDPKVVSLAIKRIVVPLHRIAEVVFVSCSEEEESDTLNNSGRSALYRRAGEVRLRKTGSKVVDIFTERGYICRVQLGKSITDAFSAEQARHPELSRLSFRKSSQ